MEKTTSHRGKLIVQDIRSVATTALFTGVAILLSEVINLIPNWDLGTYQPIVIVVLTLLLDLVKKYTKVTNY